MSWVSTTRDPVPSRDSTVSRTLRSSDCASSTMTNESCSERPRMWVSGSTSSMPGTAPLPAPPGWPDPRGCRRRPAPTGPSFALAARQVAQLLAADGIQRAEDHHLAVGPPLQHRLEAGAQRQRRLAGARLAAQRHDAHRLVEQQVERDPLLGGAAAQPEHLAVAADQLNAFGRVDPAQRVELPPSSRTPVWHGRSRASARSTSPSANSASMSSAAVSISCIPDQPEATTSCAWYSSAARPTAAALTRSGMSLLTR